MGFIKKATEVFTGKTEQERLQERAANKQIRKEVLAAQLRERREQAVKYAQEMEKLKYQQRLKQAQAPRRFEYGSVLGQPRILQQRTITQPVIKRKKIKKPKTRVVYKTITQPAQERKFDVIGW